MTATGWGCAAGEGFPFSTATGWECPRASIQVAAAPIATVAISIRMIPKRFTGLTHSGANSKHYRISLVSVLLEPWDCRLKLRVHRWQGRS